MMHQLVRRVEDQKAQPLRPRARSNSGGSASRFIAVSVLCVIAFNRSQAALAPKRPQDTTPAASSFLSTSCSAWIEPCFSRCHCGRRRADQSRKFVSTAKYFASAPPANSSPCLFLTRMAA